MDFSTLKQKIANLFSLNASNNDTPSTDTPSSANVSGSATGSNANANGRARATPSANANANDRARATPSANANANANANDRAIRSSELRHDASVYFPRPLSLFDSDRDGGGAIRIGALQRSGPMAVAPLFGPDRGARFMPPLSGLKLSRVAGYGNVEIECRSGVDGGVAILPLHIGYIQDKAQNHALCRSALMGSGQKRMFDDACCVQSGQGGFLEGRDQWFFVLPVELRETALSLRGTKDFKKLWGPISKLNVALGLPERGHLEQIICHDRYYLTQYSSRFELLPGQTGALFFANDELIGIEVAPNAEYFAEAWMPLVCFSYGVLAKKREDDRARKKLTAKTATTTKATKATNAKLEGTSIGELRSSLIERRRASTEKTLSAIGRSLTSTPLITEEERFLDLRLSTIDSPLFKGQVVEEEGRLIYLSLFASSKHLDALA